MNESPTTDDARTPYEVFIAELGRDPSAAECEQWAVRHAGDPEEPRALVAAGWHTARGGDCEGGLALFRRAAGFGGEFGWDAQVGIVEQLYNLLRVREANTAQRALRAELDEQPGGRGDLRVFEEMAEALCDVGQFEVALEWCEAGLDRAAEADDAGAVADYRRGLLITLDIVREELDIEQDDEDPAMGAKVDAALAAIDELLRKRDDLAEGPKLDLSHAGTAFDGIILRWERADFAAIRSRWQEATAHYGDDYETYTARIQREARAYDNAGAARVRLVSGKLADYEAYARREGRDPADQSTRQDYGQWCTKAHPGWVLLWPPSRNGACWCDSGRKGSTMN